MSDSSLNPGHTIERWSVGNITVAKIFKSDSSLNPGQKWSVGDMKQYHILKSDSHLNLALMLLKYIVPHLKSESSLKITCFMIYTSDQTIAKSQISFKSEINFDVSCFLFTSHHYVYSCCGTREGKECRHWASAPAARVVAVKSLVCHLTVSENA